MIDASKYPNLDVFDRTKGMVAQSSKTEIEVWIIDTDFKILRYNWAASVTYEYAFPTLEEALKAANGIDGTAEGWNAISQFLEK